MNRPYVLWFHLNFAKVMVAMVTDKLVLNVCIYNKCSKWCSFTHMHAQSLCFRLNTSSSTASMLVAVRAVLGLPLPDFLVIGPVCFKCLTKSFNVFFPSFSRKFIYSSNCTTTFNKIQIFDQNSVLYAQTIVFCLFCIGVGVCFVVMATAAAGTPLY